MASLDLTGFEIDGYPVRFYSNYGRFSKGKYKFLTAFLVNRYGTCYHCGIPVHISPPRIDGKLESDRATIDHITPRPVRQRNEVVEKVLSCYGCNARRNDEFWNDKDNRKKYLAHD